MVTIISDLSPGSLFHWPPPAFDEYVSIRKRIDLLTPGYREPTIHIFQGHLIVLYILVQGLAGQDKHCLPAVVSQKMTSLALIPLAPRYVDKAIKGSIFYNRLPELR